MSIDLSTYKFYVTGYQVGLNGTTTVQDLVTVEEADLVAYLQGMFDGQRVVLPKTFPQLVYAIQQADRTDEPGTSECQA